MLNKLEAVAWADPCSNRVSRKARPDWINPEPLVHLADVREIAEQAEKVAELQQMVEITRARCAHLEVELAQARASRESYKDKYERVATWMRKNVTIAPVLGSIVPSDNKSPNVRGKPPKVGLGE